MSKEEQQDGTIFQFLAGSHSYDGIWFSDSKTHPQHKGSYWWRSIMRKELESREKELEDLRNQLKAADEIISIVRNFIRTNHLTHDWEAFIKEPPLPPPPNSKE